MFHSRDSPRLSVCDAGVYLEQNDIGFITVAICGDINTLDYMLRSDLIVFVVVIVHIFIDVRVLDGYSQIFRCETQYDIIQVLTYCEKTEKK